MSTANSRAPPPTFRPPGTPQPAACRSATRSPDPTGADTCQASSTRYASTAANSTKPPSRNSTPRPRTPSSSGVHHACSPSPRDPAVDRRGGDGARPDPGGRRDPTTRIRGTARSRNPGAAETGGRRGRQGPDHQGAPNEKADP